MGLYTKHTEIYQEEFWDVLGCFCCDVLGCFCWGGLDFGGMFYIHVQKETHTINFGKDVLKQSNEYKV